MATNETALDENTKNDGSLYNIFLKILVSMKKMGWLIIVLACVGMVILGGKAYLSYTPQYSATATLTVSTNLAKDTTSYNNTTASSLAKTFPYILTSGTLKKIVAKDLGLGYMPGSVKATALEGTNLFTITVTSSDYEMAYKVLKSVINNYPEVSKYVIGDTDLTIISPPTASSIPINGQTYQKSALIGGLIGVVIAIIIIFLMQMFNATMYHPGEISTILNCKKLGVISKVKFKKSTKNKKSVISITDSHIDNRFVESIISIRNTMTRKCKDKGFKSIMITSTASGEGKTTIACNIAYSLAMKHFRTIIIDCDLRNPSVRKQLEIKNDCKTIGDILSGKANLSEAIIKVPKTNLYALLGSEYAENASELISSDAMKELLKTLNNAFDYIIIDAPPVGLVSDAIALQDEIDSFAFVVRHDYEKVKQIQDALESFDTSRIYMLGCIYNRASSILGAVENNRYGYKTYGYGNYGYEIYNSYRATAPYLDFNYKDIDKDEQENTDIQKDNDTKNSNTNK
ncbi:MAG TPA: polysaccharide biosynthesis tyrosine autokinase [Clostridiales bacterium]|nr:polysaccharide biosynthesis tyrosine autokinase [Clostridiales bacterium]